MSGYANRRVKLLMCTHGLSNKTRLVAYLQFHQHGTTNLILDNICHRQRMIHWQRGSPGIRGYHHSQQINETGKRSVCRLPLCICCLGESRSNEINNRVIVASVNRWITRFLAFGSPTTLTCFSLCQIEWAPCWGGGGNHTKTLQVWQPLL